MIRFFTQCKLWMALAALVCFIPEGHSQDIHFSQYWNNPLMLNPAMTGTFDGDIRYIGNLRDQWAAFPVTYRTGFASADMKFLRGKNESSFFGGGATLFFDHAGDAKIATTQLGLNGSYTQRIGKSHFLSIGLNGTVSNRAFKYEKLTWDAQYYDCQWHAGAPSGENFDRANKIYADFGTGINYHFQPAGKRTRVDAGLGYFHINEPKKNFWNAATITLPARYTAYLMTTLPIGKKTDLRLMGQGSYQGTYTEHVVGAGARHHISQAKTREMAFGYGMGYRFNARGIGDIDAIYPYVQMDYKQWNVGLSYDINLSDAKTATYNRGGLELSVIYTIKSVPVTAFCPTCPTYL